MIEKHIVFKLSLMPFYLAYTVVTGIDFVACSVSHFSVRNRKLKYCPL